MKYYKINDLHLDLAFTKASIISEVAKVAGTQSSNINDIRIIKKSLDARHGKVPMWNLAVCVGFESDKSISSSFDEYIPEKTSLQDLGLTPKKTDLPVYIVGSGPAGLFSALTLQKAGIDVCVIERGLDVEARSACIEYHKNGGELSEVSNVQFGEGGAGTFSDGKLNTGTKGYNSIVYGEFVAHGAPDVIMYEAHPHIGTDYLRKVVKNMRDDIISHGGRVLFNSKFEGIQVDNGELCGIVVNGERLNAKNLILAMGQSADDTYEMLFSSGVMMEPKPFSVGVRIEHIQDKISFCQYGKYYKELPPADYKLATHLKNGRGVYTFCMCPGGEVVSATCKNGSTFTNGMSNFDRAKTNANSAVLVSVTPRDYGGDEPLKGLEFRRKIEEKAYNLSGDGKAPVQKVGDFLKGRASKSLGEVKPSFKPGTVFANLWEIFPGYISEGLRDGLKDFGGKISEFKNPDGVMTGVETRSSSPIRILRDEKGEASIKGIYPVGEGAGYAGGITSSASDGIGAAIRIINKL